MTNEKMITISEGLAEKIEQEADKFGVSEAEYIRRRFNTGRLIWETGSLDGELLTELTHTDLEKFHSTSEIRQVLTETERGNSKPPDDGGNEISTLNRNLNEVILREIPNRESGDAVTEQELHRAIFGTEEERKTAISDAIDDMYNSEVTRRSDGKIVRL